MFQEQKNKLGIGLILKLNLLIMGFLLVLLSISNLKSTGLPQGLAAILGIPSPIQRVQLPEKAEDKVIKGVKVSK